MLEMPNQRYFYLGKSQGLTFTHRGHRIFVATYDLAFSPWIIMYGKWEEAVEQVTCRFLKAGDIAIEVGSNMGYHTLAMGETVGPTGKIYAFEASPAVYELLKATIDINGFSDRVAYFNKAALDHDSTVELQYDPQYVGSGTVVAQGNRQTRFPVVSIPAVKLDTFLTDLPKPVSLIRIDAEGSEPLILAGAEQIIRNSPNIRIILEWSVGMMSQRVNIASFIDRLVDQGFMFWRINHEARLIPLSKSELEQLPHSDIVLSRQNEA